MLERRSLRQSQSSIVSRIKEQHLSPEHGFVQVLANHQHRFKHAGSAYIRADMWQIPRLSLQPA